jgi:outer membrane protein assembly factor BamB
MRKALVICVLLAHVSCHDAKRSASPPTSVVAISTTIAPQASAVPLDPEVPLRVEALGTPVRSSRAWTTALVPNARGGWNFIAQSWELHSHDPPEYVVVDLEAGTSKATDAPKSGYANSNYQVANQLRAANGRVFFPLSDTGLDYYDPKDETVKHIPPVIPPSGPDKILYFATFGPDGMLYAGTQSNALPTIVQIDPNKLTTRVIGHVGHDRKTYSYAYKLAIDPPWIYAVVGQMPWELAALNIKTGESKILATRTDRPWMDLETRVEGVRAQLVTNGRTPQVVNDYVWCVDGKAIPVDPSGKLPFKRSFAPPKVLAGAPEIDVAPIDPSGVGKIKWRAPGSTAWKVVGYKVKHTMPIGIEALISLPDGSMFGGTQQYHGFFKTQGSSSTFLGGPTPSQSVLALLDGTLYITGYPNSVLYAYDPKRPWTGTTPEKASEPDANPLLLGNFTQSGAKYAYFIVPAQKRLYFAGRLERDGTGGGVGYYEPATKRFEGHHDKLADVTPAGLVVLPELQRVVLSSRVVPGSHAQLVVYDNELAEIERLTVKPDLIDTGSIFPDPTKGVIVGVLHDAVYRYDIAAKKLLDWRAFPGKVTAFTQRPTDRSIWVVIDRTLERIDPVTLQTVAFGKAGQVPADLEFILWQGEDLYATVGAELYRIARVGLP